METEKIKRPRSHWLVTIMLVLCLAPFIAGLSEFGSSALFSDGTVAYAKPPKPKHNPDPNPNPQQDSQDDSDNSKSDWSSAVTDLSVPTSDKNKQQAQDAQINPLNMWGYMGNANSDLWTKNDASSWAVSYNALLNNRTTKITNGYKYAGRFAYGMQSSGLDKPVKSGFGKISPLQTACGWLLEIAYYVLNFANNLFNVIVSILQVINPLHWIVQSTQYAQGTHGQAVRNLKDLDSSESSIPNTLYPLAHAISVYYGWFADWGWAIMGAFLACGIGMSALGISVGQSGGFVGQGKALASTMTTYLKRLFVWVVVPLFALSMYDLATGDLKDTFDSNSNSVTNYSIFGSFDDYANWVYHTRLEIPKQLSYHNGLPVSFNDGRNPAMSHKDVVSIDYLGAGDDAQGLYDDLGKYQNDAKEVFQKDSLGPVPAQQDQGQRVGSFTHSGQTAIGLLENWTSGTTMTAGDYGSTIQSEINATEKRGPGHSSLSETLEKDEYNNNALNQFKINNGALVISGPLTNFQSDDVLPDQPGGLSTLGLYNYMLTTSNNNGMTIAAIDNLSSDVALPQHYTVNLVGTGMIATGNALWSIGLTVGLALLVTGYAFEIIKSIVRGIPAMTVAVFQTGFGSIKGGVQLISVVTGVLLGTLGSAFLFKFSEIAFITLAEWSDSVIHNELFGKPESLLWLGTKSLPGGLQPPMSYDTATGAMNCLYGVFMLFLSVMLLRYRGVILTELASLVEETANKILATFGNVSGTGSAGTRGAISQNTNSSNTWGNNASSMIQRGGMGALMAGGAGAGLSALGKGMGKGKGSGKGKAGVGGTGKNNLGSKNAQASHNNTSSAKQGNASGRMGAGKSQNAASALGKQNAERNGSQLGQSGKGINDAGRHAPAGQGRNGSADMHGQGTMRGQGGVDQAKVAGSAAGDSKLGTAGNNANLHSQGRGENQSQGLGNTNNNALGQNDNQGLGVGNDSSSIGQGYGNDNGNDTSSIGQGDNQNAAQESDMTQQNENTTLGGSNDSSQIGGDQTDSQIGGTENAGDNLNDQTAGNNDELANNISSNLNSDGDMQQLGNDNGALNGGLSNSNQTNESQNRNFNPQTHQNNNGTSRMNDLTNNNNTLGANNNGDASANGGNAQGIGNANAGASNDLGEQRSGDNPLGATNNNLGENSNLNQNDSQINQGNTGDTTNTNSSTTGDANGNELGGTGDTSSLNQMDNSQLSEQIGGSNLAENNNGVDGGTNSTGDVNNVNEGANGLNEAGANANATGDTGDNISNDGGNNDLVNNSNTNLGGDSVDQQSGTLGNGDSNNTNLQNAINNTTNDSNLNNSTNGNLGAEQNGMGDVNNSNLQNATNNNGTNTTNGSHLNENSNNNLGGNQLGAGQNGMGDVNNSSLQNATNSTNGGSNINNHDSSNTTGAKFDENSNNQLGSINNAGDTLGDSNNGVLGANGNDGATIGNGDNGSAIGGNSIGDSINNLGDSSSINNATDTGAINTGGDNNAINSIGGNNEANNNMNSIGDSSSISTGGDTGGINNIGDNNNDVNSIGGTNSTNSNLNAVGNNSIGGSSIGDSTSNTLGQGNTNISGDTNNDSIGNNTNNTDNGTGDNSIRTGSSIGAVGNNTMSNLGGNARVDASNNLGGVQQGNLNATNSIGGNQEGNVNATSSDNMTNNSVDNGITNAGNSIPDNGNALSDTGNNLQQDTQGGGVDGSSSLNGVNADGLNNSIGNNASVGDVSNTNGIGTGDVGQQGVTQQATAGDVGNTSTDVGNGLVNDNPSSALGGNSPLDSSITPDTVQSQMGDVQSAQTDAQQAQTLAQQNPGNSVLQQRATAAGDNLSNVQNNAMTAYNSQPVSSGLVQSQWLGDNTNGSQISVGNVNNAMDSVYNAQQNLTTAQSQFGADSPQVQSAQGTLQGAQQSAIQSGLSSTVVNNPQAVAKAHANISQTRSTIKAGTFNTTSTGSGLSGGHASNGGSATRHGSGNGGTRSIGI